MKIYHDNFYSRADRRSLLFIVIVILLCMLVIWLVERSGFIGPSAVLADSIATDSTILRRNGGGIGGGSAYHSGGGSACYAVEGVKQELFPFDPNTADSTQFLRLGLQPWQVRNIYKYRAHGGIYRQPSDFARVYGLTKGQYERLLPYIRISDNYKPASQFVHSYYPTADTTTVVCHDSGKLKMGETVSLAAMDTTIFMSVPGIGSYYSRQIVRYGRLLGGYISVDQLDEIDNFPSEAKQFFIADRGSIVKLNINKLKVNELAKHPYIGFFRAKAMVDYRRVHGNITNLSQLSLLRGFSQEERVRMEPYIEY
ncbi:MAG: helix-hairpin-helix domain-containing protein [Prevotella sp.]|nr:helix-hairpin-helix domain-containing protein [Prevotella sp.]